VKGDQATVAKQLGGIANRYTATEYTTVRAAIRVDGTAIVGLCARDATLANKTVALTTLPTKRDAVEAAIDDRFQMPVALTQSRGVPPGLALVDEATFRRL